MRDVIEKYKAIVLDFSLDEELREDGGRRSKAVIKLVDHSRLDAYEGVFERAEFSDLRPALWDVVPSGLFVGCFKFTNPSWRLRAVHEGKHHLGDGCGYQLEYPFTYNLQNLQEVH